MSGAVGRRARGLTGLGGDARGDSPSARIICNRRVFCRLGRRKWHLCIVSCKRTEIVIVHRFRSRGNLSQSWWGKGGRGRWVLQRGGCRVQMQRQLGESLPDVILVVAVVLLIHSVTQLCYSLGSLTKLYI